MKNMRKNNPLSVCISYNRIPKSPKKPTKLQSHNRTGDPDEQVKHVADQLDYYHIDEDVKYKLITSIVTKSSLVWYDSLLDKKHILLVRPERGFHRVCHCQEEATNHQVPASQSYARLKETLHEYIYHFTKLAIVFGRLDEILKCWNFEKGLKTGYAFLESKGTKRSIILRVL